MFKITQDDIQEYNNLIADGYSQRKACEILGIARSTMQDALKREIKDERAIGTQILFWDLESSLMQGMFFGLWGENIQFKRVTKQSHLLTASWAFNDDEVQGVRLTPQDVETGNDLEVVVKMIQAINSADVIVTFNGKRFDCKLLNTRALFWGLPPIKPVKHIDLFEQSKRLFKFPSNSMQNISLYLGENGKLQNSSDLWERCSDSSNYIVCDNALDEMLTYNKRDIVATRDLFSRFQGWMKGIPNIGFIENEKQHTEHLRCVHCGSEDVDKMQNKTYATVSSFDLYRCGDCKGISRVNKNGKHLVGVI